MNNSNTQPLTREVVLTAVQAMRARNLCIATKESDSAQALLSHVLLSHCDEFLGAWLTLNAEYSQLVLGVAALLRRAVVLNAQQQPAPTEEHFGGANKTGAPLS
jgi:hypothetical protein